MLPKSARNFTFEVQQRSKHPIFVTSLLLVDGALTVSDHVHRATEIDDPVGPYLVTSVGGFVDAEPLLFIAQREAIVAVSAAEQRQNLVAEKISHRGLLQKSYTVLGTVRCGTAATIADNIGIVRHSLLCGRGMGMGMGMMSASLSEIVGII
jgi:hypothetical protein